MSQTGAPATNAGQRGAFITVEGVDGAGKSTQCSFLCDALEARGYEVVRLHEPGGTAIGERIRALLLDKEASEMDATCELLLFEAARRQLVAQVIEPALARGAMVVSDRFFDSTSAYQGCARGLGMDTVEVANRLACADLAPDCTILLDLPTSRAFERVCARGDADRMEQEGTSFQELVRQGFERVAAANPVRIKRVEATGTPQEVFERVCAALAPIVPLDVRAPEATHGCA